MSDDRRQDIADAVRPVLEEGEGFTVHLHEGEVYVVDADRSVVAARHPRLYGRLLAVAADLDRATAGLGRFPALLAAVAAVGLHLGWWTPWLGGDLVEKLDKFWFYLLLLFGIFQILGYVGGHLQRAAYRHHRAGLHGLIAEAGVDLDELLTLLDGDEAVAKVSDHLKLDAARPDKSGTADAHDG